MRKPDPPQHAHSVRAGTPAQSVPQECDSVKAVPGNVKLNRGQRWIRPAVSGILRAMSAIALSELLGAPVLDPGGQIRGRVREVAVCPQADPVRVCGLIVKTKQGDRLLPPERLAEIGTKAVRASAGREEWAPFTSAEGMLLLGRDVLDQQIIDVHGRKVVRANDLDFHQELANHHPVLKVAAVDVGARGAVRRLLQGIVPAGALHALAQRLPARAIPWEFVDLIETDPARRVKLKIAHERLAKLHPADIADIV